MIAWNYPGYGGNKMGIWNQSADDNNGAEVNYTGRNIYHLTSNDGNYDAAERNT